MNTHPVPFRVARHFLLCALIVIGGHSFAADPPAPASPEPSKEMRAKMATLHEQMAACLRSDKPFATCHAEAMQYCHANMGQDGCMGMGRGMAMGMHPGMQPPPAQSLPKK